jgi:hypothetical protein
MNTRSERMLAAGWVLQALDKTRWEAVSPENKTFVWANESWSPSEADMIHELEKNERAVQENQYSTFLGTSRLTDPAGPQKGGILIPWLLRGRRVRDGTILRARVAPDPEGDDQLYQAGARRVETLLQPWPATTGSSRDVHFHLLLCEHIADVLPKPDRTRVLKQLVSHLHPQGEAFFSFYEITALPESVERKDFSDGYVFPRGRHRVFLKPYLPARAEAELTRHLRGSAEQVHLQFDEFICSWRPDA